MADVLQFLVRKLENFIENRFHRLTFTKTPEIKQVSTAQYEPMTHLRNKCYILHYIYIVFGHAKRYVYIKPQTLSQYINLKASELSNIFILQTFFFAERMSSVTFDKQFACPFFEFAYVSNCAERWLVTTTQILFIYSFKNIFSLEKLWLRKSSSWEHIKSRSQALKLSINISQ